jgi:hypothetical protein
MPGSYHGIGTIYYGNREKAGDGSFITTKWAIFMFVPLFPLAHTESGRLTEKVSASSGSAVGIRQRKWSSISSRSRTRICCALELFCC